jgi:hypothetical protein
MKSTYPVFSNLHLNTSLHRTTGNYKPAGTRMTKWFINRVILAALLLVPFISNATIVYVTPTGAGTHSGTSWANACNLSEAAWAYATTNS